MSTSASLINRNSHPRTDFPAPARTWLVQKNYRHEGERYSRTISEAPEKSGLLLVNPRGKFRRLKQPVAGTYEPFVEYSFVIRIEVESGQLSQPCQQLAPLLHFYLIGNSSGQEGSVDHYRLPFATSGASRRVSSLDL